jgi:pyrroline-5-carboxylate reductase
MHWDSKTGYTREELERMIERLVVAGMDSQKAYELVLETYGSLCKEYKEFKHDHE